MLVLAVDTIFWTVATVIPAALVWQVAPTTLGPWISIGLPALVPAVGGLVKSLVTPPRQLQWDHEGFEYRLDEPVKVKWAEYRGHRFTWSLPARLRLLRAGERSVPIDVYMFDAEQRTALFNELVRHEVALPNTRLKLPALRDLW